MMAAFILVLREEEDLDTAADRRAAKLLLTDELLLLVLPPVVAEVSPRFLPRIVCMIISLYLCALALVDAMQRSVVEYGNGTTTQRCVHHRRKSILVYQDSGHGGMLT